MRRKSLDSLGAASSRHDWHVACPAAAKFKENERIRVRKYDLKTAIASDAKSTGCDLYPLLEESGVSRAVANLDTAQAPVDLLKCVDEFDEDPVVFRIKCDEERERIRRRNYITEDEQKTLIKASVLLDTPSLAREIVRNHLQYKDEEHSAFLTYQYATLRLRNTHISQNNMCDDRLFLKAIEEVERCRKRLLLKAKKEIVSNGCGTMHNQVNEFFADVLNDNTSNNQISSRKLPVSPLIVDELEKVKVKLPRIGNSPLMKRRINSDGKNTTKLRFPRSNDDPVVAKELLSSKLDEFKALFHDKGGGSNSSEGVPVDLRSNSSKSSLFESLENEKFKKLLDLESNESAVQGNSQGSTPRSLHYMRLKAALHAGDQASSFIYDRIFNTPKDKVQCL